MQKQLSPAKVMISVAPVKSSSPLKSEDLLEDVLLCREKGASILHLHCKNPQGLLTADTSNLAKTFAQVHAACDIILQASTGGVSSMTMEERCRPLKIPLTEMASLNGGSTNLGEVVYINSLQDIRYSVEACYQQRILPEIEIFDIGMLYTMEGLRKSLPFLTPVLYNFVFGHPGGLPAEVQVLAAIRGLIPSDCLWGVTHYGREDWLFLSAALALGADLVRIGFEDSSWLSSEESATHNYQLVQRLSSLIQCLGREVATVAETRKIFCLSGT